MLTDNLSMSPRTKSTYQHYKEGCAWEDLAQEDPTLHGRVLLDHAAIAMWTTILAFFVSEISDANIKISDLSLPSSFSFTEQVSLDILATSALSCLRLLSSNGKTLDKKDILTENTPLDAKCFLDICLAQTLLIEVATVYSMTHGLDSFYNYISNYNGRMEEEFTIEKLHEILTWTREDVLGLAAIMCRGSEYLLN